MQTLEQYLSTEFLLEKQEEEKIEKMLRRVTETFARTAIGGEWPISFNAAVPERNETTGSSQGTAAMVLAATGRIRGKCYLPDHSLAQVQVDESDPLEGAWQEGLKKLIASLESGKTIQSSTFGENNALTLSHITELWAILDVREFEAQRSALIGAIESAKSALLAKLAQPNLSIAWLTPEGDSNQYVDNTFVPLRALRSARELLGALPQNPARRSFFESRLHDQLSFSSIPDSRFDPAELVFCLEGLLLSAPGAVDQTLFNRVLEVLAEAQDTSAHWRPNKPFLATTKGGLMIPLSVEVANSLMRSIASMDEGRRYDTFTARALPLLKRFWHWLEARAVRFEMNGASCAGWHSEHVNQPDLVHIWDTAQVTEFMISFLEMIRRHVGNQTLLLSHLDVKDFVHSPKGEDVAEFWESITQEYEPLIGGNEDQQVYWQIGKKFVLPWSEGKPTHYSMLLYGPPGTGKTTVADSIAKALSMPLITVTVSDFLGGGGENVEARAKAIFQTLEAQKKSVILFDEIDSFLLDRDSKFYRDQQTVFQFLTPGMLTKINNLRKSEKSIFIIATNYASRIDPAIKRKGRIDCQYLLQLPDAKRRLKMIRSISKSPRDHLDNELAEKSLYAGFSDIRAAVIDAGGKGASSDAIIRHLERCQPSASRESYLKRALVESDSFPEDEFEGLCRLASEVNRNKEAVEIIERFRQQHHEERGYNADLYQRLTKMADK